MNIIAILDSEISMLVYLFLGTVLIQIQITVRYFLCVGDEEVRGRQKPDTQVPTSVALL